MKITSREEGDITVLSLKGDLEINSVSEIKDFVANLCNNKKTKLVIDLSEIELVDSMGLGVLVGSHLMMQEKGGWMVLVGLHGQPETIMFKTKMNRLLKISSSLAEAANMNE